MSRQDVDNWPSANVIVSYDAEREQIRYCTLSTGEVLRVHDLSPEPKRVVYPFWRKVEKVED